MAKPYKPHPVATKLLSTPGAFSHPITQFKSVVDYQTEKATCMACIGVGRVPCYHGSEICPICKGSGYIIIPIPKSDYHG